MENVPPALKRSLEGLERIAGIVRSVKEFAHPDVHDKPPIDINQAIRNTLLIASHEYKYFAETETELGDLPPVVCHPGEINQVLLNLVVNAVHAIEDVVKGTDVKGRIVISSRRDGDDAVIWIRDTGGGIPLEVRKRVFDPFFTTKEVGRGTGQGLAMAGSVIVHKHQGAITFESDVGKGTTFCVRLPVGRSRTSPSKLIAKTTRVTGSSSSPGSSASTSEVGANGSDRHPGQPLTEDPRQAARPP